MSAAMSSRVGDGRLPGSEKVICIRDNNNRSIATTYPIKEDED